jgi:hypothetical protein
MNPQNSSGQCCHSNDQTGFKLLAFVIDVSVVHNRWQALLLTAHSSLQRVAHSIFGSRTLLHLKKAADRLVENAFESTHALTTLAFRVPSSRARNSTQIIVEGMRDDIDSWFAPDPELYPAVVSTSSARATNPREDTDTGLRSMRSVHPSPTRQLRPTEEANPEFTTHNARRRSSSDLRVLTPNNYIAGSPSPYG